MKIHWRLALTTLLFIAIAAVAAFADNDPPSRVARLKYTSGQVSMQPGGVDDWVEATINRPLTTADRVWTDKESRAELHLGSAAMRMDSETSLTLTNLTDNTLQLELDQGTLNLQVTQLLKGEVVEVDTPNTAFTILKSGSYRFDVDSQGDSTLVTVWKGKGIATGDGRAVEVESRRRARFGDGRSLAHRVDKDPRFDGFDDWCRIRDERESHVVAVRYVSPEVIGYEDLDSYGSWRVVPNYGVVWVPTTVVADWAPYRYGHWTWIEPWGWTWVDDAPWGFAPFHYGRWVVVGRSWAWVPGPVHVRPYYAPALVAWIGGVGISIGGGGVGWFPLGYGEPYIPHYRVSRGYFQNVNISNTRITNITYVTNNYYNVENVQINNIHYVNRTAVTVVNQETIVNSRSVYKENIHIDERDWHNRTVIAGPAIPPSRDSVLGRHGGEHAPVPSTRIISRPVVVHMAPPERRVPFEDRREAIVRNNGRPLDSFEERRLRKDMPHRDEDGSNGGNINARRSDHPEHPEHPDHPLHPDHPEHPENGDRVARGASSDDRRESPRNENAGNVAGSNARTGDRPDHPERPDNADRAGRGPAADGRRDFPASVPRPPRRGNDADRPTSAGALGDVNPPMRDQRPPSNDAGHRGNDPQSGPSDSDAKQRDNASSDRAVPRPSFGDRDQNGSQPQQQRSDRFVPRPPMDRNSQSQPSQPSQPSSVQSGAIDRQRVNSPSDRAFPRPSSGDRDRNGSQPQQQSAEGYTPRQPVDRNIQKEPPQQSMPAERSGGNSPSERPFARPPQMDRGANAGSQPSQPQPVSAMPRQTEPNHSVQNQAPPSPRPAEPPRSTRSDSRGSGSPAPKADHKAAPAPQQEAAKDKDKDRGRPN
jgi:hypothetical protein